MVYRNAFHVLCSEAQHLGMQARESAQNIVDLQKILPPRHLALKHYDRNLPFSRGWVRNSWADTIWLTGKYYSRALQTRKDAAYPSCGMANKWVILFVVQQQIHEWIIILIVFKRHDLAWHCNAVTVKTQYNTQEQNRTTGSPFFLPAKVLVQTE